MWSPAGFLFSHFISHLGTLFRMDLLLQLLISADDLTNTLKCALLNSQVILNPIRWTMRLTKPSHTHTHKSNEIRVQCSF